jgi:site-specific DNA recombinase
LKLAAKGKRAVPEMATVRVAVYTRKSVADGLDQAFNSLDAQRETVEAFVRSQSAKGWAALPEHYDDGGFTGANTDRPAFQRLLADIEAGRVDAVAVYRTDRLSRSLLDFMRLIEFFNSKGVAYVSVTEAFDNTTPMGRMFMHLLASFAQFERESIAQRTRDKMVASRRRGMWTGGRPVLGYDVVNKKLVANESEAEQVREIYRLYLDGGSITALCEELRARGWTAKSWTNAEGKYVRGGPFCKSTLHGLLTNPLYVGKVRAAGEVCEGEHDAILDDDLWQAVQDRLAANADAGPKRSRVRNRAGAILKGLLYCGACGSAMTYHYTQSGGRKYAYYVCSRAMKQGAKACPGSRVAVGELEAFVLDQLRAVGRDPGLLRAIVEADQRARDAQRPEVAARVRLARQEHDRLDAERANLVEAVAEGGGKLLMPRLAETDRRLDGARQALTGAQRELAALDAARLDPAAIQVAIADLEPVWAELFPKERARLLALLLERVEYDASGGEVALRFRAGGPVR